MEALALHTRRSFATSIAKFAGILGLGSMVTFTTACPAWLQTVYTDIKAYGPTILSAVAGVVSILMGAGILSAPSSAMISAILALISNGVGDLQVAINTYQSAPASQKATLAGKIATILADIEANVQGFWSNLTIPDPALATTIENLLGVVISTLQGYINALGVAPVPTPAIMARSSLRKLINAPAKRRSLAAFKSEFNGYLGTTYSQHKL